MRPDRRHDPQRPAEIFFKTPEYDLFAALPAHHPVGTASHDHAVANIVIIELFTVKRSFIRMVEMTGQRREGESHAFRKKIRFRPDYFKLPVVDDPHFFDPAEIPPQRCCIHIRIFHHINVKFEVMGGYRHIFPFLASNRIREIVPQHPGTQLDPERAMIRRFLPGFRQKRLIDTRFFQIILRKRTVGKTPEGGDGRFIHSDRVQVAEIRGDRLDHASAGLGFSVIILCVCCRGGGFRFYSG